MKHDSFGPAGVTVACKHILIITKAAIEEPRDGGAIRTRAIADELAKRGYSVRALPVKGRGPRDHLPRGLAGARALILGLRIVPDLIRYPAYSLVKWLSWAVLLDLAEERMAHQSTPVVIDSSQIAIYRRLFPHVIALSLQNVEYELLANYASAGRSRLRRAVAAYDSAVMRRFETDLLRLGIPAFVVSEHDRDLLMSRVPKATIVVAPNGVSDGCFTVSEARTRRVVFVGHLGWRPNIDAASWLVELVWPLVHRSVPDATLHLVGRSPSRRVRELVRDSVEVHGDVESVLPYVSGACAATAPLLAAGGTRLKILEAMACGTPVVSTPLGALGLEAAFDSTVLRVESEPERFAEQLIDLLRSGTSAATADLCRQGAEGFRWARSLAPMISVISEALGDRS